MNGAALYECEVAHLRRSPVVNRFRYGTYLWLVDLDHLPHLPWPLGALATFDPRDHLADPAPEPAARSSIRDNVDRYLATQGIDLDGGPILMLGAARVLGYVFNPISVMWCHDRAGRQVCVVVEVHNTYGERHCYLVRTDDHARAEVPKTFHVSPFEGDRGRYEMRLPRPAERLDLSITLHRAGQHPFVATVSGTRRAATVGQFLRLVARHPWAPLVVTLRIRRQGVGLWLRRLPVVPRSDHVPQEAVQ